jgi:hypothetical protein
MTDETKPPGPTSTLKGRPLREIEADLVQWRRLRDAELPYRAFYERGLSVKETSQNRADFDDASRRVARYDAKIASLEAEYAQSEAEMIAEHERTTKG